MTLSHFDEEKPDIAIVGGGIIGLVLATGLIKRGINVNVYEQARSLREIGAGIAFTANAVKCMGAIDPKLVKVLRSVATANGDPKNPNDYLQWVDGFNVDSKNPKDEKLLYKLYAGEKGFEGCHRAQFLDALSNSVPEGIVHFRKRLANIVEKGDDSKIQLRFDDGTLVETDAVIGCDGIKSRVREWMFGENNPVSHPTYTHKVAYRGLIPMDKAVTVLGEYKAKNQHMHIGPGAHLLHFPVANQTLMNVVAFASDPEEWEDQKNFLKPATRKEVQKVFSGWGPTIRDMVSLLPENIDKWAVFDSAIFPVPCYNKGRICLAGDAAHAAAPHHGAGAGIGVEDALCLSTLLEKVVGAIEDNKASKADALKLAFSTFNAVRRQRTQWLVQSSHDVCEIYEWNHPKTGADHKKCFDEIKRRSHKIWYFDFDQMVRESCEGFDWRVVIQGLVSGDRNVALPIVGQTSTVVESESATETKSTTKAVLPPKSTSIRELVLDSAIKVSDLPTATAGEMQVVEVAAAAA